MPALITKYGEWDFFKLLVERNILDTDAELSGTKKIPQRLSGTRSASPTGRSLN